jgi:hypothetical protein
MPMIRRHRYAVALVCLAALVMALGIPTVGLPLWELGEPIATIAAPAVAPEWVGDRSEPSSSSVARRTAAPRGPPSA